jgi:hypothetical protein
MAACTVRRSDALGGQPPMTKIGVHCRHHGDGPLHHLAGCRELEAELSDCPTENMLRWIGALLFVVTVMAGWFDSDRDSSSADGTRADAHPTLSLSLDRASMRPP